MSKKTSKRATYSSSRKYLKQLVKQFEAHIDQYKASDYNEATLRIDFLNKFFEKVLGWDVRNDENLPPSFREVVTEDTLQIEGRSKAPDYAFRKRNGSRLFFVEAKKPKVNISRNIDSSYQVRRYGWNANLSVSILTNFEYFAVYDCTIKPKQGESATKARLKVIKVNEYLEHFDYLWGTFSWEAVKNGSLTQFSKTTKKKGMASVDEEFLKSLDDWRIKLAKAICANNDLDEDELNIAVQLLVDRIIFLRNAEDRGVEDYGRLDTAIQSEKVFDNLKSIFASTDERYNSGLFKDNKLINDLVIPDRVLLGIVNGLYYPESPYEFSVLPLDIMGKAYEQFLGKRISLTSDGNVKVDAKPAVRKAGGVYYTHQSIVDLIVDSTIGRLVKGKTPKQVSKMKFLDPASGSGTFLICAFEYLILWHKDYYSKNASKLSAKKKKEILTPEGELTTKHKSEILLNNIYGIDIDANACEVTKLSLLLKCLEGETRDSLNSQLSLFHERFLPTLDQNIRCGNTLIDFDIYITSPDVEDDLRVRKRINAFNWKTAFKEIMKQGGFDAIIGNPPYIHSRDELIADREKKYFYEKYTVSEYQLNTFCLFIERGLELLKSDGLLGYIIPNYWLSTSNDKNLRDFIFKQNDVYDLINVYNIFKDAIVDTLILTVAAKKRKDPKMLVAAIDRRIKVLEEKYLKIADRDWFFEKTIAVNELNEDLEVSFKETFELSANRTISNYLISKFGAKLYEVGKGIPPQTRRHSQEKVYESEKKKDNNYKKLLRGKHIKHFQVEWSKDWVRYGENLAAPRNPQIYKGERILLKRIISKPLIDASLMKDNYICLTDVITLLPKTGEVDCRYFLGIINSKVCSSYIRTRNVNLDRDVFPKINANTLDTFPVPDPNSIPKSEYENIVTLVDQIQAKMPQASKFHDAGNHRAYQGISNEIDYLEDRLNHSVYKLYSLSPQEIKFIEKVASA